MSYDTRIFKCPKCGYECKGEQLKYYLLKEYCIKCFSKWVEENIPKMFEKKGE
jgi:predicted Zn-ribbon and HTH transcriptional regulator